MKGHRGMCRVATLPMGIFLTIGLFLNFASPGYSQAEADGLNQVREHLNEILHDKTKTIAVNCAKGETIARALRRGNEDKPLVVIVRGICSENVVIDRDDVTLSGDGGGVTGLVPTLDTILIHGARRVVIENLAVTEGKNGITFLQGAGGTVDSCTVQNTGNHGIRIEGGSAMVINTMISSNFAAGIMLEDGGNGRIGITNSNQYAKNIISANGGDGIHLQYGATAIIGGNDITGNGTDPSTLIDRAGIALYHATAVLVGGNMISGNQGGGIVARSSSLRIGEVSFSLPTANTISGNGIATSEGGVNVFVGTALDIRFAAINGNTGNGVTGSGSSVRIRNSTISGNMGGGVLGFLGTALDLNNNMISGNTSHGVAASFGTALDIRNTAVNGNGIPGTTNAIGVALSTRSVARMREGNTIQNNTLDGIQLTFGSGLLLQAPVSVTGNGGFGLSCIDGETIGDNPRDRETSYFGDTSGIGANTMGTISPNCTGFFAR